MSYVDTLARVTMPDGRQLVGATFRGVPFYVESGDRSGGRRIVRKVFPQRDTPVIEDNGRRAATYRVDGYVIGDDYIAQRDALLAALEGVSGPGELVHPYYGTLRAACAGWSVRESTRNGGQAVFSIEFYDAPDGSLAPTVEVDTVGDIDTRADAAVTAARAAFLSVYSVSGQPSYATESLSTELAAVVEAAGASLGSVVEETQELARLTAQVDLLAATAAALVRTPDAMIASIVDMIADLAEASENAPRSVIRALLDTYLTPSAALAPAVTATRVAEAANHAAISAVLRSVMAVEAARLVPTVPFVSFEDAIATRDTVLDALDEQIATAGNLSYTALVQLRAAVASGVPGDTEYARRLTVVQRVSEPSLAIAYRLYGSVELEQDIIDRNGIDHPAFVLGSIEVLSDG